jgi:large subunit ribosomal protein L29
MAKAYEFRDMDVDSLEAAIVEEAESVMNMRMQLGARTLDNPLNYRAARRNLARMKTVLNEKRREAAVKE